MITPQIRERLDQIWESAMTDDEKINQTLQLGNEAFDTSIAILSRVDKLVYKVYRNVSPADALTDGQKFVLGNTYCHITLAQNNVVAIHEMRHSVFAKHPCYGSFKLETYIGAPIKHNHLAYGTLNFSKADPHNPPFSDEDKQFIEDMVERIKPALMADSFYTKGV
ncbi:MAG: GAF domain-containing protein [Phototrophicaceae bacterium]